KSKGIRKIDKLILTHGDADHIGGAVSLFGEIQVEQMILPRSTERSKLELDIITMAAAEGTMIYFGGEGNAWEIAEGEFKILGPSGSMGERNERSIILQARFGGRTWLFTGDLGIEGEQALIHRIGELDIDVLKVGHHGSKYSTSDKFLEALTPDYAVISAGLKNRYGHPDREVLERLDNSKVHTLRTDKNGAAIYRFKGESGTFFTHIP
ncbi:MAG TPA: DNA internalization-related competence protein ComEC/Rec2, partial [Bacillus bacterium]|nr:DNA internalization-related competence protein ComEC/Rec2 [Bacillus sp. (in: firmicutes)]